MTLDSAMKSAVGIGQYKLRAIKDTFLKTLPLDSTNPDLREDQKLSVKCGFELEISSYKIENEYCRFESSDNHFLGQGYAFLEHIEIDGQKLIPQLPINVQAIPKLPINTQATPQLVSRGQLLDIAIHSDISRLDCLLQPINDVLARYQINTPLRVCHFLAQIAHESDGFNTNEEYASGEDYEERGDLGNIEVGDGVRFKGRGLIQVTGRANYGECSDALGFDLINNPEQLASFDLACLSAGWYWDKHNLNSCADDDDIMLITRIINGGYNGLDDRQAYLDRAKTTFGI